MFPILYGIYVPFYLHFKMLSAIRFNLEQSKILPSGNGLKYNKSINKFSAMFFAWLYWVVLGFNATLTAKVISWRSVTHMSFLAFSHQYENNFPFQSHRLLFPHASAEVRGNNTPERNFASTRHQTHNHQVMSPTCSPLRHKTVLGKALQSSVQK